MIKCKKILGNEGAANFLDSNRALNKILRSTFLQEINF